ncbi:MAG TPA: aldo/keto reductase, partial [Anaerolineae bacterium]
MEYKQLGQSGLKVSRVGIGGHYKAMEEGAYEDRYAYVEREVAARAEIVSAAITAGVNYFDTTWRNEVAMLGAILRQLDAREQVLVNGMVLGAFVGSKATGLTLEDYFNRWLDERLEVMPGHRFDAFMVNAIEEGYNDAECERLLALMEKRRTAGDFKVIGFSSHDVKLARHVADRFPAFELVMVPYNFHNRRFEEAFAGYSGHCSFIAMKTQVWLEYGIPFSAINALPRFADKFGFEPAADASTRAIRFVHQHPLITTAICAINSMDELTYLLQAGSGSFTVDDEAVLRQYQRAVSEANSVPLYLGALQHDNLRMNFFGASNLSRVLGVPMPHIPLNEVDSQARIQAHAASLMDAVRAKGYGRYLELEGATASA